MADFAKHRFDELPMDRRIAGEARGVSRGAQFGAVYERREVDPTAAHVKRRTGTKRVSNAVPNLLGLTYNGTKGRVVVDRDFTTESAAATGWTIFGTVHIPTDTNTDTKYFRVLNFANVRLNIKRYDSSGNTVIFEARKTSDNAVIASSDAYAISGGNDLHFALCYDKSGTAKIRINAWRVSDSPSVPTDNEANYTVVAASEFRLLGENALSPSLGDCVLNNVRLFDNDNTTKDNYNTAARSTSTEDTGLIWQSALSDGGDLLTHSTTDSYLIPTNPVLSGSTIRFGGLGVIEVPFYLDFDEYFWTSTNAAARLEWCFQLKLKLPKILKACTVFELQDLVRLEIVSDSGFKFRATYNDGGTVVTSTVSLSAGTSYDVFVARDTSNTRLKVGSVETTGSVSNPIVYNYDKTIGFVIGDKVDFQNTAPFGGQLEIFALHNNSAREFQDREDAVVYYDTSSIQGDEVLDQGNRALNAYLGVRSDTQAPFYREGGFPGGAYVAACGGYLVSNSKPDIGYNGQLRKPLTKDVVIQRRGRRAFLTSNGVNYIVDDRTKNIRPLGIPRPSTKVSCIPQGVGAIDGFVRYAYRYITIDGTVGPIFELDPCDATGGVNVFLGAEAFGTPVDPAFGLSFGEAEKEKTVAADAVECFIARDKNSTDATSQLLHKQITDGLTLETAFRLPTLANTQDDSILSQGVYAAPGETTWCADNEPVTFPWIGAVAQECCFQLTFRYKSGAPAINNVPAGVQTLFCIGNRDQKYRTGGGIGGGSTHWRLQELYVSIQPPASGSNSASIVVTRDDATGNARDNELKEHAVDVTLVDGHDYTLFVQRTGSDRGHTTGGTLEIALYNHNNSSLENWPAAAAGSKRIEVENFWTPTYSGAGGYHEVMWGMGRREGSEITGKTRCRQASGSATFEFDQIPALYNGSTSTTPGTVLYHGRMWRRAFPLALLVQKGLSRYGARSGPLALGLEVDVAFASDASAETLEGGFDFPNDTRVKFYNRKNNAISGQVLFTGSETRTVFLAYGAENTIIPGTNPATNSHAVTSTDDIPLWAAYTSRDAGTLVVGTGEQEALTISKRKWHAGAEQRTFDDFANVIDLKEWNWLTLFFSQEPGIEAGASSNFQVWLQRVFLDGNTGEWGEFYNAGTQVYKNRNNTATGDGQYSLFTVGGVPGIDTQYEVEIAEVRLWDGERYISPSGGNGTQTFGPYLSARVPPNYWDEMHHYLRFAPIDVNDMSNQSTMDQVGTFADASGNVQASTDSVTIYQNAAVKEAVDPNASGGANYFIPFPKPPQAAIRGIEIFRTQVVPVQETFISGATNPQAQTQAFKACRAAPLYYLTEIPDGTQAYYDSATDSLLGAQLNLTEGLIPGNPGGVFEWNNYLGIWVTDAPRIHFAASPDSWESFPSDMVFDLPLKETGIITAAAELASRDARNSRVLLLGQSWGAFLDGNPTNPQTNTLGGGVGASTSRCLVIEKGVAYAYNGTLWAITGDGQVEDIGMPVLDLLPPPDKARLSVSSSLSSLYVINEETGLTLRWHFARREWFVEDRNVLSTTDIDGVDNWVHVSGYPSAGDSTVYADDVESNTPTSGITVNSISESDGATFNVSSTTGIKVGQRHTVVADQDPRIRHTLEVASFVTNTSVTYTTNPSAAATSTNNLSGSSVALTYKIYVGVGYWGTMLDTGQFTNTGVVKHVDIGVTDGDGWHATSAGADFASDPTSRTVFDSPESSPTAIVGSGGGGGTSSRWGLTERQKVQRLLVWTYEPQAVGLSELELNYNPND
jgi:hypothetical protein